ncbi:MAG TPA: PaaI family thioesterase [Iamia sp.]|nr:PaaI family thioesterase [Iamia sp.]
MSNETPNTSPRVSAQSDVVISDRRRALRRIAAANRDLIEDMVGTDVDQADLVAVAEELEALAARFRRDRPRSMYEGMGEAALSGGDFGSFFDHSPMIGLANPLAPPIRLEFGEDSVVGRVTFGAVYEGPPGTVHGGFVAAAFDEVLGSAQSYSGAPGMTARLIVNYRKPTPLHTPLAIEGRFDRREGRKVFTTGRILVDGVVTAEAEGLFVSMDAQRFRALAEGFDRRMAEGFLGDGDGEATSEDG